MGRLIVVSNRVSPPQDTGVGSTGGLAMAIAVIVAIHFYCFYLNTFLGMMPPPTQSTSQNLGIQSCQQGFSICHYCQMWLDCLVCGLFFF